MALSPYRIDPRARAAIEWPPRAVGLALSLGALAFAMCSAGWLVCRTQCAARGSSIEFPIAWYSWITDIAFLATSAACALKPVPATRSHWVARIAGGAYLLATVLSFWPEQRHPSSIVVLGITAQLTAWIAMASIPIEACRNYAAVPRWVGLLAIAAGATVVGTLAHTNVTWTLPSRLTLARDRVDEMQMLQFVLLTIGFTIAAKRVRRSRSIPMLVGQVPAPKEEEVVQARIWIRGRSGLVGTSLLVPIACFAGEALLELLETQTANDRVFLSSGIGSIFGAFFLFVAARRASHAAPTLAGLVIETTAVGTGFAAAASLILRFEHQIGSLTLRSAAIGIFCVAMIATTVRIVATRPPKDVATAKIAMLLGGATASLTLAAALAVFAMKEDAPFACGNSTLVLGYTPRSSCFLELLALGFAIFAVRKLERLDARAKLVIAIDDRRDAPS